MRKTLQQSPSLNRDRLTVDLTVPYRLQRLCVCERAGKRLQRYLTQTSEQLATGAFSWKESDYR